MGGGYGPRGSLLYAVGVQGYILSLRGDKVIRFMAWAGDLN